MLYCLAEKNFRCGVMDTRITAHSLLALSVILVGVVIGDIYGGVVEAYDRETEGPVAPIRPNAEYRVDGRIEALSFENRRSVNDTVTLTVRNLGNVPIRIRYIVINNHLHTMMFDAYMLDSEGNFYFTRTIPAGGFGIIKLDTLPADLEPEDNTYNVNMRTSLGTLRESFKVDSTTYRPVSSFEPLTPYIFAVLFGSTVSLYYYRRFKMLE